MEATVSGLSPRVRGNHINGYGWYLNLGSIPARAGEPKNCARQRIRLQVYPRACGGTADLPPEAMRADGLSPRVRGNRSRIGVYRFVGGSIPARAGEPAGRRSRLVPLWVYPRACGGTGRGRDAVLRAPGLSPRVRGNQIHSGRAGGAVGSIPARAGEPSGPNRCRGPPPVYPRACGGTPTAIVALFAPRGLSPRVRGNRYGHV